MTLRMRSMKYPLEGDAGLVRGSEAARLEQKGWHVDLKIDEVKRKEWLEIRREIRNIEEVARHWNEKILSQPPTKIGVTLYNVLAIAKRGHGRVQMSAVAPGGQKLDKLVVAYHVIDRPERKTREIYVFGDHVVGDNNLNLFLSFLRVQTASNSARLSL